MALAFPCGGRAHGALGRSLSRVSVVLGALLVALGAGLAGCRSTSTPPVCLEQGEGLAGCAEEYSSYERCVAPCLDVGSSQRLARRVGARDVKAELVRAGCGPCGKLEPGAPAGAPCESQSVCAQVCCCCPAGRASVLVRACVNGACAEDPCASARSAVDRDPCQPR